MAVKTHIVVREEGGVCKGEIREGAFENDELKWVVRLRNSATRPHKIQLKGLENCVQAVPGAVTLQPGERRVITARAKNRPSQCKYTVECDGTEIIDPILEIEKVEIVPKISTVLVAIATALFSGFFVYRSLRSR
jgi:hypothetical protein